MRTFTYLCKFSEDSCLSIQLFINKIKIFSWNSCHKSFIFNKLHIIIETENLADMQVHDISKFTMDECLPFAYFGLRNPSALHFVLTL